MTDSHLSPTPGMTRIGPYSVDRAALEISRDGARIDLSPQAVRVLLILADRAGELVTRQELYESLWPEADVDMDRGLNTLIRSIRHALGDSSTSPTWIRTYPRRGYRFLVAPDEAAPAESAAGTTRPLARRPWRTAALAACAALLLFMSSGWHARPEVDAPASIREAWLAGRYLLEQPSLERRAAAVPYFEDAVRREPGFAPAQAYLADALFWAGRISESHRYAASALALDPGDPHALFMSGVMAHVVDWDWSRAERLLRAAVRRAPGKVEYRVGLAFLLSTAGRRNDAVRELERARELKPVTSVVSADLGFMFLYSGLPGRAAEACERAFALAPDALYALDCAIAARELLHQATEARGLARKLLAHSGMNPDSVLGHSSLPPDSAMRRFRHWKADRAEDALARGEASPFAAALAFAMDGRVEPAIAALGRAAAGRSIGFVSVTVDPRFAVLYSRPGFSSLVQPIIDRGAARPVS